MLTLNGTLLPNITAGESFSKTGIPITAGETTTRIQLNGFDSIALYIAARILGDAVPSDVITTVDDKRWLPVALSDGTRVGLDVDEFMQRFHWSEAKFLEACRSQGGFEALLAKRVQFGKVLSDYHTTMAAFHEAQAAQHDAIAAAPDQLPTYDEHFPVTFSHKQLMKVLRVARRTLRTEDVNSGSITVNDRHFMLQDRGDAPLQVVLWSGNPFPETEIPEILGTGKYSIVQAGFYVTNWSQTALKIARSQGYSKYAEACAPVGSPKYLNEMKQLGEAAIHDVLHEVEIARQLPSGAEASVLGLTAAPYAVFNYGEGAENVVATLWPRFRAGLDTHILGQDGAGSEVLNRLTRLEILKRIANVMRAVQYLHDNKVIHGDISLGNIRCDDLLKLYLGDFGGSRTKDSYDLAHDASLKESSLGGCLSIPYTYWPDAEALLQTANDAFNAHAAHRESPRFVDLKELYWKQQVARDTLSIALIAYNLLGYVSSWCVQQDVAPYLSLTESFHRKLELFNPKRYETKVAERKSFYGEEIFNVLDQILQHDRSARPTLAQAIDVFDRVVGKAESDDPGDLIELLAQTRPIPAHY